MKKILASTLCVFGAAMASSVFAATWYVDDDNYGKKDLDGISEASAFGTIQDALDNTALSAGDTVLVLPGVYTNGARETIGALTRVIVNKSVKLVSKEGKEATHIVGAPDPSTEACGENSVRCLAVTHMAHDTEVRGFTIRNGYTGTRSNDAKRGGGVYVNNNTSWIIDCVISNCTSDTAAMFKGNAYRTWFTGNRSSMDTGFSTCHSVNLHTCLVSGNVTPVKYLVHVGCAVNTTFANNAPSSMGIAGSSSASLSIYNCVVLPNEKTAYVTMNDCSRNEYSLIAPALGDFRVKAGGTADGTANRKWLDGDETAVHLPEGEPLLDFHGNPYPESGPVHKGCIQETVEAKGGLLKIDALARIEGVRHCENASYLYPVSYPCQYRILPVLAEGEHLACWNLSPASRNWRLPEADNGLTVMPPPLTGGQYDNLSVIAKKAASVLHVAIPKDGGDDETGDGSAGKPFATIQKAVDMAVDDVYTVILVDPGTYGEGAAHYPVNTNGTVVAKYGKASVTVHEKKRVRILSVAGPEKTVLVGAADPEHAEAVTLPGCGSDAAKCIIFLDGDVGNGIQGFTLTGGHSTREKDAKIEGDNSICGGAWYAVSGRACIADCIISNNVANTYAAGAAGVLDRLYVTDNYGSGTIGVHPAFASSCVFVDNPSARTLNGVIGGDTRAYNCTIIESDPSAVAACNISSARIFNSIVAGGKTLGNNPELKNTILWGQTALPTSTGFFHGDPNFADMDSGDFRVKTYSFATRIWGIPDSLFYQHTTADIAGKPIVSAEGKAVVGSFAETVDVGEVFVKAEKGGVAVEGGNLGYNVPGEGGITLFPAVSTRPCIGYLINGVANLFADLKDGKLVLTADMAKSAGGISVEMIYDNNWYADAENGDDANPGFAILPKKTLAAAMAMAVSGDVVHAAPGDYCEGLMGQNATCMISSRVVVASGVLLKADKGPEETFITGADATINPITGTYAGCGANAVRCVWLCADSKIQGFTVRHGRFNGESPDSDETRSGGIRGAIVSTSVAEDCIITDCWGWRGGALYSVNAVRCFISDCKSQDGPAGKIVYLTDCVFDRLDAGVSNPKVLSNCTFLPGCKKPLSGYFSMDTPVRNSIITKTINATENNPVYLYNCVVAEGVITDTIAPYVHLTDCVVTNVEAIALMDDGRIASGSCAIDFGSNDYVSGNAADVDIAGGQRIYNGRVDAGAYEFDWREDYAGTILAKRCTVVKASPEVLQGEGKVLVTGTLDTEIARPGTGRRYLVEIPVKVTGNGVLTIAMNGEAVNSYTLDDGAQTFSYNSMNASESVSFVYVSGESDTGCAEIGSATTKSFAFTVILR